MQNINTSFHASSIKASSLDIALTDMNVNGQVIVTEPYDYTENGQSDLELISHSVQHLDTTTHSTSSAASLSAISLIDMNINT